ncbi:hypothetical protein [Shimia sp. MMG029]|uniref:hypothetical protein n=1 Tax=Shimia sp. MMG029 TaxID=3021978 RepID=UPI0022FDE7E7|nr:hypothetical protein [Shimia sp. MMG029]MDA5556876.1 hypothetical protein [Shimia sp. MMG029]
MDAEFRELLSDISQSFLDGNLALWRSRLVLPFSLITKSEHVTLETEEAIAENFELYLKARDAMCVDFVDRTPISLEPCPDGTWHGTFQTRLLGNETLITPPYTGTALMMVIEDRFRMSSVLNARGHKEWTDVIKSE